MFLIFPLRCPKNTDFHGNYASPKAHCLHCRDSLVAGWHISDAYVYTAFSGLSSARRCKRASRLSVLLRPRQERRRIFICAMRFITSCPAGIYVVEIRYIDGTKECIKMSIAR